ncbi:ABC transporter C family member 13 [Vitis vinifera]|uniref:ABC transporter C family member 13 n=1 Tax=Vitis vinifera TaxID=29760 RepID=A0A438G7V9_VITVI|nr:ABC transporter C family member 13 [Vitis vinifera]
MTSSAMEAFIWNPKEETKSSRIGGNYWIAGQLRSKTESITEATTIRCFNQEDRFLRRNLSLLDDYSHSQIARTGSYTWFESKCPPSLGDMEPMQCRKQNDFSGEDSSIHQNTSEAPLVIENYRPSLEWPSNGRIDLDNPHVQYTPTLPMVLRSITWPSRRKENWFVDITGSGKSTLIQALFLVVESSKADTHNGVDISKMGLKDLRESIQIKKSRRVLNMCCLAKIVGQDKGLLMHELQKMEKIGVLDKAACLLG